MTNLGLLYESQGRFDEAYKVYSSAARSRTVKLGDENPSTLTT